MKKLFTLGAMLIALATNGGPRGGRSRTVGRPLGPDRPARLWDRLAGGIGERPSKRRCTGVRRGYLRQPGRGPGERRCFGRYERRFGLRLERAGRPVGRRVDRHRPGRLGHRRPGRGRVRTGERQRPGLRPGLLQLDEQRPADRLELVNHERRRTEPVRQPVRPRVDRHRPGRLDHRRPGRRRVCTPWMPTRPSAC